MVFGLREEERGFQTFTVFDLVSVQLEDPWAEVEDTVGSRDEGEPSSV